MKIRIAKIFTGTKDDPSYKTQLQHFDSFFGIWEDVKEEWATKQDEEKYIAATHKKYLKEHR